MTHPSGAGSAAAGAGNQRDTAAGVALSGDAARFEMSDVLKLVSQTNSPVMVLEVPSKVILAASPGAHELLDHVAQPLIGRNFEELIEGHPSGAMPLLAAGRITGYETTRVLKLDGQRRRLWITELPASGRRKQALVVLLKDEPTERAFVPSSDDDFADSVVGSTDARLIVDRVSPEVYESLGFRAEDLIGTSLLALIAPEHVADVLSALAQTSKLHEGVTARVNLVRSDLAQVMCQLVLLPLAPAPSCAFALLLESSDTPADGRAITDLITRLGQRIRGAVASQAAPTSLLRSDVDLARLSSREVEIVTLLVGGNRVPLIAKRLFLSEGTVRNNLSSVFSKLGVATQQELIELLRPAPAIL